MVKKYNKHSIVGLEEIIVKRGNDGEIIFKLKNTKAEIIECTEVADVTLDSGLTVREHRLKEYPRRIKIEAELPVIEVIVKQNLWKRIWRKIIKYLGGAK
jgi:hypothetical protein